MEYLDFELPIKELEEQLLDAEIFMDVKHSDHCPVYVEIKI